MSSFVLKERSELESIVPYQGAPQLPGIILDANENAHPMPEAVKAKVMQTLDALAFNRYPQIDAADLRSMIAQSLGVESKHVQVGNGSSELLTMSAYAFGGEGRKVSYIWPSFSMYKFYAQFSGSTDCPFMLEQDFAIDYDKLKNFLAAEKPALIFICNPNNPTGTFYDVKKLCEVIKNSSCLVLMDEAYMEFADEGNSMLKYLDELPNMAVLRTFSKAYGLASGRVGYIVAKNEKIIEVLGKALLPYHVNAMSLAVAQTVYQNRDEYKASIKAIIEERKRLSAEITALGMKVYPSQTNFIFFTLANSESNLAFVKTLTNESIFVRDFSGKPELGGIRLTVGTKEENDKVLAILKEFLQ